LATIALGGEFFQTQQGYQWNLLMAGGTISLRPGLILGFVLRRYPSRRISRSGIGVGRSRATTGERKIWSTLCWAGPAA
jgi:hypothetical protein